MLHSQSCVQAPEEEQQVVLVVRYRSVSSTYCRYCVPSRSQKEDLCETAYKEVSRCSTSHEDRMSGCVNVGNKKLGVYEARHKHRIDDAGNPPFPPSVVMNPRSSRVWRESLVGSSSMSEWAAEAWLRRPLPSVPGGLPPGGLSAAAPTRFQKPSLPTSRPNSHD